MGFFDVAHVQLSKLEPDGGSGEVEVRNSRFRPITVAFSVVAFAPLERKSVSALVAKKRYRSGSDIGAIVSPVILTSQAENAGSIPVIRSKLLFDLAEQGFSTCIVVFCSCIHFLRLPRFAVDFASLLSQRCRKSRRPLWHRPNAAWQERRSWTGRVFFLGLMRAGNQVRPRRSTSRASQSIGGAWTTITECVVVLA